VGLFLSIRRKKRALPFMQPARSATETTVTPEKKMHGKECVSPWVARWSHLVPRDVEGGRVLDIACGAGRHLLHFLRQNRSVVGLDIAENALEIIASQLSPEESNRCQLIQADLENAAWPLPNVKFAGVIVTNYLWRPLIPVVVQSLADGGLLIYETFSQGNETVGKPSRSDFLLKPGELLQACSQTRLRVIAYEDGFLQAPDRFMQRVVAIRENSASDSPARHALPA
jgi:SAM-dependent methyltransferase